MNEAKNHLTVVDCIYHVPFGSETVSMDTRYSRELQSEEQPYIRKSLVCETWKPLDCGWLTEVGVGLLFISNEAGKDQQVIPTDEQRRELASRVVEVAYEKDSSKSWIILPGESMRATPEDATRLFIRCRCGTAVVNLMLIPR